MEGSGDDLNRVTRDTEPVGEERDEAGVRPAALGGRGDVDLDPPVLQSREPLRRGAWGDPDLQNDPGEGTRFRHAGNFRGEGCCEPVFRRSALLLLLFLLNLRRPWPIQPDGHAAEELARVPVDPVIAVQQVLQDCGVPGQPG